MIEEGWWAGFKVGGQSVCVLLIDVVVCLCSVGSNLLGCPSEIETREGFVLGSQTAKCQHVLSLDVIHKMTINATLYCFFFSIICDSMNELLKLIYTFGDL